MNTVVKIDAQEMGPPLARVTEDGLEDTAKEVDKDLKVHGLLSWRKEHVGEEQTLWVEGRVENISTVVAHLPQPVCGCCLPGFQGELGRMPCP